MSLNVNTFIILVLSIFVFFDVVVSSYAASNFQLLFNSPASPVMQGIVELHDYIMFLIFLICVFVFCIFFSTLSFFYNQITFKDSNFSYSPFQKEKGNAKANFNADLMNIKRIKHYIWKVFSYKQITHHTVLEII